MPNRITFANVIDKIDSKLNESDSGNPLIYESLFYGLHFCGIMSYSTRNGCDYIITFNNVTCCMVFFQNRKCENYLAQN